MLTSAMIFCLSAGLAAAQPGAAPGIDAFGDPLPPGAVTRIGTIRFRHSGIITSLAYSPDGKRITSAAQNAVAVWEAETGRRLSIFSFAQGYDAPVLSPDGTLVAHSLDKDVLCVREAASGKIRCTLPRHKSQQSMHLAFSKDGRRLAYADEFGTAYVWDTGTGKLVRRWPISIWENGQTIKAPLPKPPRGQALQEKKGERAHLAFTPDGKALVYVEERGTIVSWNLEGGKEVFRRKQKFVQQGLAISPDGQMIATANLGGRIYILQAKTGELLCEIPWKVNYLHALTFAPDGRHLVWGSSSGLQFWNLTKNVLSQTLPARGSLVISPSGKTMASASGDHIVHVWDLATGKEKFLPARGFSRIHPTVRFLPDGKTLFSTAHDHWLFQDLQGKVLEELPYPEVSWYRRDISPDGMIIAVGDDKQRSVRLYDKVSGTPLVKVEKLPPVIHGVNFSPDGRYLFIRTSDYPRGFEFPNQVLHLWKRKSKSAFEKINEFKENWSNQVIPLSHWLGIKSNRDWKFHSYATGRLFRHIPNLGAQVAAVSASGRILVMTEWQTSPVLWEMAAATPIRKLEWNGKRPDASRFAFSPDGKLVAAGQYTGAILFWDVLSGKQIAKLEGHDGWIHSLEFSPDGRLLLSAGHDTTVMLWDCEKIISRAPPRTDFTVEILNSLWADLEVAEPERGYQAVSLLVAAPDQAVPLLRKKMKSATATDQRVIQGLIDDLDKENFQVRSRAAAELAKLGELAEPLLLQTLTRPVSLECQRRVKALLEKMPFDSPSPAWLRALRALEALELIGTPDALALVADLSNGFAAARQTQEARLTLERMKKRGK